MDFESRQLLLFHQSAAADRRGEHPLHGAGTTGHRICTTAGNDCVIQPQENTLDHEQTHTHTPLIQYTSSQLKCSFPLLRDITSFIATVAHLLSIHYKSMNIYFVVFSFFHLLKNVGELRGEQSISTFLLKILKGLNVS